MSNLRNSATNAQSAAQLTLRKVAIAALILAAGSAHAQSTLGFKGGLTEALGGNYTAQPNTSTAPSATLDDGSENALLVESTEEVSELDASKNKESASTRRLKYWNTVALDAMKLDHTALTAGEVRTFGEQFGPHRAARVMAIVQIAVFDAVNSIRGGYKGYAYTARTSSFASVDAAVAQASHDTLVAMYPSQKKRLDATLAQDLARIPGTSQRAAGIALGQKTAAAILALRANDGSDVAEPRVGVEFLTSDQPGKWRPDPISQEPLAVGAFWSRVKPFVVQSASQFRPPAPPPLTSPEYTAAYKQVAAYGDSAATTPRNDDQTAIGIYWAYDGTPGVGAPPRLYNQVIQTVSQTARTTSLIQVARLLALSNVAMADAALTAWEAKFHYQVWRPVGGVREADAGSGPTGLGDNNAATLGDPNYSPLGAPASNLIGPNFTPPFPSYPSGHATLGGALFQSLRNFYRTDTVPFTFVSDEYNGITRDNAGVVRPLMPRSFASFAQAEEENGISRIYLGVHYNFDKVEGISSGQKVANYVFQHAFTPVAPASTEQ